MLRRLKHVSTGFDVSKVANSTWKTKNVQDGDLRALLDENAAQTQKELNMELGVDRPTISRHLHAMRKIRKLQLPMGRWVPHQFSES